MVFVGAGVSRLVGCPSWDGFADKVLEQLVPDVLDYHDLSQIDSIRDPRKRLSIAKIVADRSSVKLDYSRIFEIKLNAGNVYSHLNRFNCPFVTTNYDKHLTPMLKVGAPESSWRFFKRSDLLPANLDSNGSVLHLHGCVDDPKTMVITTRDYLDHYSSPEVVNFLTELFERKTVLFLGYGLEEVEVIEHIMRKGKASPEHGVPRRFMLQGFFNAEMGLYNYLRGYYSESFQLRLIGFPKDHKSHAQQTDILAAWSGALQFGAIALSDQLGEIEREIND